MFEREPELATLEAAIGETQRGLAHVVAVTGPAGIGKSRLLDAAVASARRRHVECLVARGGPHEQEYPFAVALQLFERRVRAASAAERRELFADAAGLAAPLLAPGGPRVQAPGQQQMFSLIHGLYWLAVNLSERSPLVLVVDDAHASDGPSLRFLLYLVHRLEGLPMTLLFAARSGEPGTPRETLDLLDAAQTRVLRPTALSMAAVGAFMREQLGFEGDREFTAACAEVTGGNPFLLRELAAALAAEGFDRQAPSLERVRSLAPRAVTQRLLVRLARLPPESAALARALAVLGDRTPLRTAAELAELEVNQAAAAVDALASVEITSPLSAGEEVAFVHPLVRSALYEDQARGDRMRAHSRAASLLIREGAPREQVVPHLVRGQRGAQPGAVALLSDAAMDAVRRGAPAAAVSFLERALEEPISAGQRATLLLELGRAEGAAGSERAAEHLTEALGLIDDPLRRAGVWLTVGRILYARGAHQAGAEAYEQGLGELPADCLEDIAHQLRAAHISAATVVASVRFRSFEGIESVTSGAGDPSPGERGLLAALATRAAFAGQPRADFLGLAGRAWGDGALLDQETSAGSAWPLISLAGLFADELDFGLAVSDAALADAGRRGWPLAAATARFWRCSCLYLVGRIADAASEAEAALGARRWGWSQFAGGVTAVLAHCHIERGALGQAQALLESFEMPGAAELAQYQWILDVRGRLAWLAGDAAASAEIYLEAGRMQEELFSARSPVMCAWRSGAASALQALGDRRRARGLVEEELEIARAIGVPRLIAHALVGLGLLEPGPRGLAILEEAVAIIEPSAPRLEYTRALVEFGAALRRGDHRRAAREPLERGFRLAAQGGADALAQRALVELAALGARPRKDIAARERLTPSERRVAAMAVNGMTNKQIAQALFVTLKTVEAHLHHAYEKLGIGSRAELQAALERRDVATAKD